MVLNLKKGRPLRHPHCRTKPEIQTRTRFEEDTQTESNLRDLVIDAKFSLSESKKMHDQSPIENLQKYLENVLNENVNSMAQNSERESPEEQSLPGDLKGQENGLGGDAIDPQNGESDLKNSQNDLESQSESSQNNNTIDPAQSDALKP